MEPLTTNEPVVWLRQLVSQEHWDNAAYRRFGTALRAEADRAKERGMRLHVAPQGCFVRKQPKQGYMRREFAVPYAGIVRAWLAPEWDAFWPFLSGQVNRNRFAP